MVNQQTLKGNWNEIKGKLRDRWGQVSQDELQRAHGNVEQLVGLIQRKTGEAREKVEQYLEELTNHGDSNSDDSTANDASNAIKEYAQQAVSSVQETTRQTLESVKAGYEQTEMMVRRRPVESLAVCFGAGLVTGVVVGLMLRAR